MNFLNKIVDIFGDDKFNTFIQYVKLNYSLILFYPIVILLHLLFLNLFKTNGLLDLFVIISLSNQFDIGLIKNTFFLKKKYNLLILIVVIFSCLLILSIVSIGILLLFNLNFQFKYLFIVFVGILGNEFKSFYDSKSNYSIGFVIKNSLNFSVFLLFYNMFSDYFFPLLISISLLSFFSFLFMYIKLKIEVTNTIFTADLKFFFLNIFTFASGNIDRFLVIPFIDFPLRNIYLYFTETNLKLNGLFGFLNNLFLYKQLKISFNLILTISVILVFIIFSVYIIFDIDYDYLFFSISLISSILSQYYIYSKIGDLKLLGISFFPLIGMFFYLVLFYFFNKYFVINLYILTIILILKSFSEFTFIYAVNKLNLK